MWAALRRRLSNNKAELSIYTELVIDDIIRPYIQEIEYTVDIFCDYEGNPVFTTPRIRVAVRTGEVLKTEIAMDEKIIEECRKSHYIMVFLN